VFVPNSKKEKSMAKSVNISNPFASLDQFKNSNRAMAGVNTSKSREDLEIEQLEAAQRAKYESTQTPKDSPEQEPETEASEEATLENDPITEKQDSTNDDSTDWKKRYGDSRTAYNKKVEEHKAELQAKQAELEALKSQLTTAKTPEIPSTEKELEEFRLKHPTVYNHVISLIRKEVVEKDATISSEFESINERLRKVDESEKLLKIKSKHPDAGKIKDSSEFITWKDSQPKGIQNLFASDDPDDIIEGFDLYKLKVEKAKSSKVKQENDAQSVGTGKSGEEANSTAGNKRIWFESEIAAMSDTVFAQNEKEIDQANREGRIRKG